MVIILGLDEIETDNLTVSNNEIITLEFIFFFENKISDNLISLPVNWLDLIQLDMNYVM